jgi:transcription initiation factor TFIIIB Brf1 subunit/transcription initiation factor TFIIB
MYVACKRANVPRSAKEMAKMFHIQSSTMTRGCKRFQEVPRGSKSLCLSRWDTRVLAILYRG